MVSILWLTLWLCVLINIWTKGEVGAPLNRLKPSSIFYWPFQGGCSIVDHLCYLCFVFVSWSTSVLRVRLVHRQTGLSPPVKYFTDPTMAVLLLWFLYVFFSFLCLLCLCTHLFICALWSPAGKGLTSWLSFVGLTVSLLLFHWCPGSGVVLDFIDS